MPVNMDLTSKCVFMVASIPHVTAMHIPADKMEPCYHHCYSHSAHWTERHYNPTSIMPWPVWSRWMPHRTVPTSHVPSTYCTSSDHISPGAMYHCRHITHNSQPLISTTVNRQVYTVNSCNSSSPTVDIDTFCIHRHNYYRYQYVGLTSNSQLYKLHNENQTTNNLHNKLTCSWPNSHARSKGVFLELL